MNKADHKAALETAKSYTDVRVGEHANLAAAYLNLRELAKAVVDLDDGDSPDLWHYEKEFSALRAAIGEE